MQNNILYKWWFGSISGEHLKITNKTPKEYLYKFFIHPIKRRVAKYYLVLLRKFFGLKVIGITGSAGKTTTKEMTASILAESGKTAASYANTDPVYNIPTTILRCTPLTRFLVLEMGVEFPEEMDFYLWLAKPDIGLITNIYPTHTEFLKNIQGIAKEKGKLALTLGTHDYAVLNKESKILQGISKAIKAKIVWYGKGGKVNAGNTRFLNDSSTEFTLSIGKNKLSIHLATLGEQFVNNSLGAAAIAHSLGVKPSDIKNGLEKFKPLEHRMTTHTLRSGAIVLDDSYNNNPEAAKEALKTLKDLAGKRKMVVVFGDMLELGSLSLSAHRELGGIIASMGADRLIGVGAASKELVQTAKVKMGDNATWVSGTDEVLPVLKPVLGKDTVVLIKGSRSISLDRLVAKLI